MTRSKPGESGMDCHDSERGMHRSLWRSVGIAEGREGELSLGE
jgi:hypothetical protein